MPMDLNTSVVLVTGASAGIGAAVAESLARRGATVAICARRADRLAEVLERLHPFSPDSSSWTVDLGDLEAVDRLAAEVLDRYGHLDALVNNAGIPKRRWAWDHRADEIADVLRVNVESPMRLTTALLPAISERAGSIVFVGSVAARLAPPAEAVYSASKAAITAYADGLRVDLGVAGREVDVHVVQPGIVDTDLFMYDDNEASLADVGPVAAEVMGEHVADLLVDGGPFETFVPGWFADLPPVKAADPDGFWQGSVEYTRSRLTDLHRGIPT